MPEVEDKVWAGAMVLATAMAWAQAMVWVGATGCTRLVQAHILVVLVVQAVGVAAVVLLSMPETPWARAMELEQATALVRGVASEVDAGFGQGRVSGEGAVLGRGTGWAWDKG